MTNKIMFGLSNVAYAVISASTEETGKITYAPPVKIPGGVNLSLDASGEQTIFYADNIPYYVLTSNNGYEGDLEMALIPDSFRKDVLGEQTDNNGLLVETSNAVTKEFALLFQFEGDVHAKRHVMYRCSATRPKISSKTKEKSIEAQTETIKIVASPIAELGNVVKASIPNTTETKAVYDAWFDAVKTPDFAPKA